MSARDNLLNFAKELADPDWSLSVPRIAKSTISHLVKVIEDSAPRMITTHEELADAQMVVVRTEAGTIANLMGGRAYCFGYEASAPVDSLALPVTVLWEREP